MNTIIGILMVSLAITTPPSPVETNLNQSQEHIVVFEQTSEEKIREDKLREKERQEAKRIKEEEIKELKRLNEKEKQSFDFDIASYTTKYSTAKSNEKRNYNMLLASDSINGTVLNPGDEFSYNNTILSKRSPERDYANAPIIVNGKMVDGIGGGICQISTTLYNAALYSGMTITQRRNHSLKVGYVPAGMDATASWGSIDFCFKNDLEVPVKIESVMENGVLKIRFLSTENPNIGNIKLSTEKKGDVYYLYRYVDKKIDYTARSIYRQ